jgi:hypothetical protein
VTLHVVIALPDGRTACADYREPIAGVMRRVNEAIMRGSPGTLAGDPADYALITRWLDANTARSELCRAHLRPGGPACGHDLAAAGGAGRQG